MKKKISIITPTYNEEKNIEKLYSDIAKEMNKLDYDYEHIIIDNFSTDNTIPIIKKIATQDKKLKIINTINGNEDNSGAKGSITFLVNC